MATSVLPGLGEGGVTEGQRESGIAQDMGQLLEEVQEYRAPRRGDVVDGVIVRVDRDSILVDIGSKTEGIIHSHEMQSLGAEGVSQLKTGDEITVYVLQTENQEGQVVLSVDRAAGEKSWRKLYRYFETGEILEAEVVGYNKGGLLVSMEGIRGFVPISQVVGLRLDPGAEMHPLEARFPEWAGRTLQLKVVEVNRRRNRLILSERAARQDIRNHEKERLLDELLEGELRQGKVTGIRNFGIFVDLGGAEGLVHISELSWNKVNSPEEVVSVGEELEVYVLKVDKEAKKIALSLRRARPEAWERVVDHYAVGQLVTGTITKLTTFGAFAHLEGPVEGLIHVSELAERRIAHPKEVVKEGDVMTLKIVRIERDRHRLGLSLKQALEDLDAKDHSEVRQQLEAMNRARDDEPVTTFGHALREAAPISPEPEQDWERTAEEAPISSEPEQDGERTAEEAQSSL